MAPGLPATTTAEADPLAALTEEVAQLRDLFQRRLFEDKAKNRLYDELHEQLAAARGGLAEQLLAPLFRELLLIVDRVGGLARDGDVVLESIVDELLELLERHGVHPVPAVTTFDPSIHEAVRAVPAEALTPGDIVDVARRGYRYGTKLLRAERVVVAASPAPEAPGEDLAGAGAREPGAAERT